MKSYQRGLKSYKAGEIQNIWKGGYRLWPCSLAVPVLAGWVYGFVVLCPGTPEVQPAVVLVLKRLRRRGNGLKSHPTDWEMPGIEPATPGLQNISLSPTPRRLVQVYKGVSIC